MGEEGRLLVALGSLVFEGRGSDDGGGFLLPQDPHNFPGRSGSAAGAGGGGGGSGPSEKETRPRDLSRGFLENSSGDGSATECSSTLANFDIVAERFDSSILAVLRGGLLREMVSIFGFGDDTMGTIAGATAIGSCFVARTGTLEFEGRGKSLDVKKTESNFDAGFGSSDFFSWADDLASRRVWATQPLGEEVSSGVPDDSEEKNLRIACRRRLVGVMALN